MSNYKFIFYIIIFTSGIMMGSFLNSSISCFLQEKRVIKEFSSWSTHIEILNGILYVVTFIIKGRNPINIVYCLMESALLAVAIIDIYTYEIPLEINLFLGLLGMIMTVLDKKYFMNHFIGFIFVSGILSILYCITNGKAIGGGDIKLMAVCGLIIGWKNIILAFFIGSILGSIIHMIRMKISNVSHMFAMGPYLAVGIFLGAMWGEM